MWNESASCTAQVVPGHNGRLLHVGVYDRLLVSLPSSLSSTTTLLRRPVLHSLNLRRIKKTYRLEDIITHTQVAVRHKPCSNCSLRFNYNRFSFLHAPL